MYLQEQWKSIIDQESVFMHTFGRFLSSHKREAHKQELCFSLFDALNVASCWYLIKIKLILKLSFMHVQVSSYSNRCLPMTVAWMSLTVVLPCIVVHAPVYETALV